MAELSRKLSFVDGVSLIVGSMIGSGIFVVPAAMAMTLTDPVWLIGAWVATAIFTLLGAACFAEMASAYPETGGQYRFLEKAFGKRIGFLYGWSYFTVIQTGTIAAVAIAFASYLALFIPALEDFKVLIAIAVCTLLTLFNLGPAKRSGGLQTIFTAVKALTLLALAILLWTLGAQSDTTEVGTRLAAAAPPELTKKVQEFGGLSLTFPLLAAALVGSIFSSDAWNSVTFAGGEMKNPRRNLPLSLLLGTALVGLLYVATVYGYTLVLGIQGMAYSPEGRVGATAVSEALSNSALGENAGQVSLWMAGLILVSIFGCLNGLIFSGARVFYAMAKDGLFFKPALTINKAETPSGALWLQLGWTCLLCLSGSYNALLDFVVTIVLLFYALTAFGLLRLRKEPGYSTGFSLPLGPVLPVFYILVSVAIVIGIAIAQPMNALFGLGLLVVGVVIFPLFKTLKRFPKAA